MNDNFIIIGVLILLIICILLSSVLYLMLKRSIQRNADLNIKYMNVLTGISLLGTRNRLLDRNLSNLQSEYDALKSKIKRKKK